MFGNSKPFGTASTFGSSTFGSTTTPFGQSNTTFGAKPATGNVFGTTAFGSAAPNTGGLFGAATPATGTSLFGQTSTAFGQPASTSGSSFGFGSTSTTGGLFGTTTQPTQSSGLFGSSNTSAFGSPRPAFGGFGSTTSGTGLFGQSTSTGTSLFGSSGGFGSTTQSGTTVKFNPPTGTDTMMKGGISTNISTRHQCITCMKEYENKSLEELRMEDYLANRKGPQSGITGFGTPSGQTGLFGAPAAASTSAFSFGTTQAKPLFGSTATTNTFGSTGTSLFGQNSQSQNTGGIFGKPVSFGTPTTSATPAFNFSGSTGTSLFGQNNQQKPLFGQPTTGTGLFGSTATTQPSTGFGTGTGFGGFGATAQPSTGLFGSKPAVFGSTGTTNTTSTFSFGIPTQSSGGLFNQKTTAPTFGTGFGSQSTGFGGFGSTQTSSTGLFGQTKPTGPTFGNTGTTFGGLSGGFNTGSSFSGLGMNTGSGTGLFSGSLNKGPGLGFGSTGTTGFGFGQTNTGSAFNFGQNTASGIGNDPNAANVLLQQQLQAQQVLALTASPFGDNPLFRNTIKDSKRKEEVLKPTNPAAQKALLTSNQYKVSPLPCAKIKPKPITPVPDGKVSLFDGLEDEEPSLGNAAFVPKRSIKKLVLKHSSSNSPLLTLTSNISTSGNRQTEINFSASILVEKTPQQDNNNETSRSPASTPLTVDISTGSPDPTPSSHNLLLNSPFQEDSYFPKSLSDINLKKSSSSSLNDTIEELHTRGSNPGRTVHASSESDRKGSDKDLSPTLSNSVLLGEGDQSETRIFNRSSSHPTGIILERPEYYTVPSLNDMIPLIDESGNCFVENFTIGRDGYGKVCFPGITNVANLNLDETVYFRRKEITVYPDDDNKPPVGEGLNRKAEITLECVWPTDKTTHSPIKDPERLSLIGYREKIERSTAKLSATFIDYKPESGSWIFQVPHFSKYGLEDSDEESDDPKLTQEAKAKLQAQKKSPIPSETSLMPASTPSQLQLPKKLKPSATDIDDEMKDVNQTFVKEVDKLEDENFYYYPIQQLVVAGVDAERIQGMKASFFQDEMEALSENEMQGMISECSYVKTTDFIERPTIARKTFSNAVYSSFKKPYLTAGDEYISEQLSSPSSASLLAGKSFSKLTTAVASPRIEALLSYPLIDRTSFPKDTLSTESKICATSRKITLKPFDKSLSYGKQRLIADTGYFMGRRFRPGWGPNWTILGFSQGTDFSPSEKSLTKTLLFGSTVGAIKIPEVSGSSSVTISTLQFSSYVSNDDNSVRRNLDECLSVQLQHSVSAIENGAPIFSPKPGTELLYAHCELSNKQLSEMDSTHCDRDFLKQCNQVWELCVALWGKVCDPEHMKGNVTYVEQMTRRESLSKWLIKTTKEKVFSEISDNSFSQNTYLATIFSHLTSRQIYEAVTLAQNHHDHGMATLLAQAEANMNIRGLIGKQLMNWEQCEAYKLINYQRLKIYALLAGIMLWKTPSSVVNCCENLDWRRALAVHLWYYCHPNSSVQEAVAEYDKAFQNTNAFQKYAAPPLPVYMHRNHTNSMFLDFETSFNNNETSVYDTCYHLLKLYCDRSHRMDKLLMPETSTAAHLDHRLSWLLFQSLVAIGYDHLNEYAACSLHCNFASQLEAMNLWHWAIFIMLHLPDADRRARCVKDMLLRYVTIGTEDDDEIENQERETFLHEQLLVPKEWIFEAKAIKARSFNQPANEAWYLLKAGFWNKSHEIVIKQLASDAIINENYDYLLSFLKELSPPERSSTILDWPSGGQVFLDYIHISQIVEKVIKGDVSAYDVEKLHPEVLSLCHRLSSIRCHSAKDRLCQSEMAKKTATLLRAVLTLQAEKSGAPPDIYMLAPHIKNLPMPEDYALQELRAMARNYMLAVTSE